jgi:DsbC/DsbD-like thiol-disulfide interchange protein
LRSVFFLVACFVASLPSLAGSTKWVQHGDMLQSRLIVGSQDSANAEGQLFAWEAKLAPGWKTYWRSPGEAGLPVRVFQGGSEIEPYYPLPERFELFGIQTFGYSNSLILPFRAIDTGGAEAAFNVDFMVCKEVCVPFKQSYSFEDIAAAMANSINDIRLESWMARVPDMTDSASGLTISSVKLTGPAGHQKLVVDVAADRSLAKADLFAEAAGMFHFGLPRLKLLENGNSARLVLSVMTGGKNKDLTGANVRFTFSDGHGRAIDKTIKLPE